MVMFKFVTERLLFLIDYMRRDVFQAIADPTRRAIIDLLANNPQNLNTLADNFSISRPAISKQVKLLTQCGLITIARQGREHYCTANLRKLSEAAAWVEKYRAFWNTKLDALGDFLEKEAAAEQNSPIKPDKHER
jgi:DNA-binding transcriptional ArsR family regulator